MSKKQLKMDTSIIGDNSHLDKRDLSIKENNGTINNYYYSEGKSPFN